MKLPSNYLPIMPYLMIDGGNAFVEFMKTVFDAELQYAAHRENTTTIMHGELKIGDAVIMFAETTDDYPAFPGSLFLYVPDADLVFKRVNDLQLEILQEVDNRPYGRGGGFKDAFGNQWWVNTPPVS